MKKLLIFLVLAIFSCSTVFSQSLQKEVQSPDIASKLFKNPAKQINKPLGSAYVSAAFSKAKVAKLNLDAFMRYNVHKDEMEFITPKNDTLILDKIDDFGDISFYGQNKKYKLLQYTRGKELFYGYLVEVFVKGDFTLYRKDNISLTEAKPAKTSLEQTMPAKYSKNSSDYFVKNKDNSIVDFPDGRKALTKMFPEKKVEIETFLKEAKIDFSEEADLIQVVNFLAK